VAERAEVDFGIVDVHAHWGSWHFPSRCHGREDLYRILDAAGIEKVVLSSTLALQLDLRRGNAELAQLVERDGERRLFAAVVVNPRQREQSLADLRRFARHERFLAVKYHPHYSRTPTSAPETMELVAAAREEGFNAFMLHTYGAAEARDNLEILRRHPQAVLFLFHMGGPEPEAAAEAARPYPNALLEPSSTPASRGKIARALEAVGAERVVFGTDLTLLSPFHTLGMVLEENLEEAVLRKVLRDNALRLLPGLEG